jgi:hypothetical protein
MAYYELVYQLEDWFVVILTIGRRGQGARDRGLPSRGKVREGRGGFLSAWIWGDIDCVKTQRWYSW